MSKHEPYTMDIEYTEGEITKHGFHLGTDLKVAESFVFEKLRSDFHPAISVALRQGGKLVKIYDYRDLDEPAYDRGSSAEVSSSMDRSLPNPSDTTLLPLGKNFNEEEMNDAT